MFQNCSSLTAAPSLPASSLADYCYYAMFYGCSSLIDAPLLPAAQLSNNCYSQMFYNCRQLSYINAKMSEWTPANATTNWVNGVAQTGTFACRPALSIIYGVNNIPVGWSIAQPLTFYAIEAGSTVKMASSSGSAPSVSLEYSIDGETWNVFNVDASPLILQNVGDYV